MERWLFILRRWLGISFALAACILQAACVSAPNASPAVDATAVGASPSDLSGGLLVVRTASSAATEPILMAEVTSPSGEQSAVFGGRLQRTASEGPLYLFALSMAPGRYVLKSIRLPGAQRTGADMPRGAIALNLPFLVSAGGPAYLGRIVLGSPASTAAMRIEDRFDEDVALFRSSMPPLRSAAVQRDVLALAVDVPQALFPAARPGDPQTLKLQLDYELSVPGLTFVPLTPAARDLLPARARPAFSRFLQLKPPRAFAISDAGDHGVARGEHSVAKALRDCAAVARGSRCRLFALDGILVPPDSGDSGRSRGAQ